MNAMATGTDYAQYTFGPDDRFHYRHRYWTYLEPWADGIVITSEPDEFDKETKALTFPEIFQLFRDEEFECDKDYYSGRNAIIRKAGMTVADLPPITLFRARMVSEFLAAEQDVHATGERFTRSDASLRRFLDWFARENRDHIPPPVGKRKAMVSPRQLRRLAGIYEASGHNPAALEPKHRGQVGEMALYTTEELRFQQKYALKFHSRDRPSKKDCWDQMHEANDVRISQGLPSYRLPSMRSFQRIISDLGDYSNQWTRSGNPEKIARKFAISRGGLRVSRPLEIVQLDEHKVNVIRLLVRNGIWDFLHPSVKARLETKKRAWLSIAIDVYSRSILGAKLLFGAPNAVAAVATLAMVARPKEKEAQAAGTLCRWPQFGRPDQVTTDAGSSYVSHEFQAAVRALTGTHWVPASRHPHLRAVIERVFRTLNQRYIHLLSGQTFENVLLRDQYDAEAHAHITDEQLADLLVRLIVDCYHNTKHRGLWGATPLQAWYVGSQIGKGAMKPHPTRTEYGEIFGITVRRKISNYGITILGLRYSNTWLQNLRDNWYHAELVVRINELDLGSIHVKHWTSDAWTEIPAVFEDSQGVRLFEWLRFVTMMKKRFGTDAKHTQEFVRKQLALTRELAEQSRKDAGILDPCPTEKEIKHYERITTKGFRFDQKRELDKGDEPLPKGGRKKRRSAFEPPVVDGEVIGTGRSPKSKVPEGREDTSSNRSGGRKAPARNSAATAPAKASATDPAPPPTEPAPPRKRVPIRIVKTTKD